MCAPAIVSYAIFPSCHPRSWWCWVWESRYLPSHRFTSVEASSPTAFLPETNWFPFVTVILLGLFLGMRHSTDPDHVVAVSTIVSRQKSIRSSATIGLLWGLGHTLTIFLVGSAIIIFGVVIPPRLGLSMEFCVALMLILLGVLNLTGVMRWITERFTPVNVLTPQPAQISGSGRNVSAESGKTNPTLAARIELFLDRTVGKARPLSDHSAVGDRPRAWPGRIGCGCPIGTFHHQESALVNGVPAGFWFRHHGRE